ncbi:SAM-dependent methyltransferase [soil metagenome]
MTPLEELIHALVASRGPITFAEYQDLALYHPAHGYYSEAGRAGWRGDYLTSPELDAAFGELWAGGLRQVWEACGAPESFPVVEIGPGEGGLAAGILGAAEGRWASALVLHLVEPSPALARRQRARLAGERRCSWASSLATLRPARAGCVIANEVLDNLPVHIFTLAAGDIAELHVASRDGALVLLSAPPSPAARAALRSGLWDPPSPGRDVAVSPGATRLTMAAAAWVLRGAVVFIDYGREQRGPRPDVVCYSPTGTDDRPLERPGAKDITVQVDWPATRLTLESAGATVAGPVRQRDVLRALGANAVEGRLRDAHDRALAEGRGADAVRALSRRSALAVLADPDGLGALGVLTACKGIGLPGWTREAGHASPPMSEAQP